MDGGYYFKRWPADDAYTGSHCPIYIAFGLIEKWNEWDHFYKFLDSVVGASGTTLRDLLEEEPLQKKTVRDLADQLYSKEDPFWKWVVSNKIEWKFSPIMQLCLYRRSAL